jgi:hypothetical protein
MSQFDRVPLIHSSQIRIRLRASVSSEAAPSLQLSGSRDRVTTDTSEPPTWARMTEDSEAFRGLLVSSTRLWLFFLVERIRY